MSTIKFEPEELDLLESQYPFSFIQNLFKNKEVFEKTGDISLSVVLELSGKTENPGLALVASLKNKNIYSNFNEKSGYENKTADTENTNFDDLNNNIATEGLAKIYLKQGLKKEAIKIYKRISLLNNKNNSTFAKF